MIAALKDVADRLGPNSPLASGDPLSDVLDTVRFTGSRCFGLTLGGRWSIETPAATELADSVELGSERIMFFHVVAEGSCRSLLGSRKDQLGAGDIIVYPRGQQHILTNDEGLRAAPISSLVPQMPWPRPASFVVNDGIGPTTRLICGFLRCEALQFNPLLTTLPPVMIVTAAGRRSDAWLSASVDLLIRETNDAAPGGRCMTQRLVEILFISILRHFSDAGDAEVPSWIAAARDPIVGRALIFIHEAPADRWTVERLAVLCGTSRARLAARFGSLLGCGPIEYLMQWRLQIARNMLGEGG